MDVRRKNWLIMEIVQDVLIGTMVLIFLTDLTGWMEYYCISDIFIGLSNSDK